MLGVRAPLPALVYRSYMSFDLAKHVVDCLNEYLKIDPRTITSLVEHRVPASIELQNHPTVQCSVDVGDFATVGMLGILNGIVASAPGTVLDYRVQAVFENDELVRFKIKNYAPIV